MSLRPAFVTGSVPVNLASPFELVRIERRHLVRLPSRRLGTPTVADARVHG